MGHETADGFQETEKPHLGCAINGEKGNGSCKSEGGCPSRPVISVPEEPPSSNCCSTSSVETAVVVIGSENRTIDSISREGDEVSKMKHEDKPWVVDLKCGETEMSEGEKVCRICHLSSAQSFKGSSTGAKMELICLGCGCNGELGVSHLHCAEAWFKLKGNRKCEICGEMANNIRGFGADKFMEEWIESGVRTNGIEVSAPNSSQSSREEVCWHGQPFCNFLMACLVIAFVLPWLFRINGGIW